MKKAPVLFLVFNRPDTTQRVFEEIKRYKPSHLYIAADAPRDNKLEEAELCQAVRDLIVNNIDWDVEIKTLFRDKNMGCKMAVSSAISWFFENEEEGIILEDDCLPHPDFFTFCNSLLNKYRDDPRVMQISGDNFQGGNKFGEASYYFSRFNHIWGWASWRRAWKNYDLSMSDYPIFKSNQDIKGIWGDNKGLCKYWLKIFDKVYNDQVNTWDYQWTYSIWKNNGLTILPQQNLVKNIGFGESFTHQNAFAKVLTVETCDHKISNHPSVILPNWSADLAFAEKFQIKGIKKFYTYFKAKLQ